MSGAAHQRHGRVALYPPASWLAALLLSLGLYGEAREAEAADVRTLAPTASLQWSGVVDFAQLPADWSCSGGPPTLKGRALLLRITDLKVAPTKPNGWSWDANFSGTGVEYLTGLFPENWVEGGGIAYGGWKGAEANATVGTALAGDLGHDLGFAVGAGAGAAGTGVRMQNQSEADRRAQVNDVLQDFSLPDLYVRLTVEGVKVRELQPVLNTLEAHWRTAMHVVMQNGVVFAPCFEIWDKDPTSADDYISTLCMDPTAFTPGKQYALGNSRAQMTVQVDEPRPDDVCLRWAINSVSVELPQTRPDGRGWDPPGEDQLPDPYVQIAVDLSPVLPPQLQSLPKKGFSVGTYGFTRNAARACWDQPSREMDSFAIGAVRVLDKDSNADDNAGSANFFLPKTPLTAARTAVRTDMGTLVSMDLRCTLAYQLPRVGGLAAVSLNVVQALMDKEAGRRFTEDQRKQREEERQEVARAKAWPALAASALRSLMTEEGGAILRQTIGYLHPTGSGGQLSALHTAVDGYTLTATIDVQWSGGFGTARQTRLVWPLTVAGSGDVQVAFDSGIAGTTLGAREKMNRFFRAQVHPTLLKYIMAARMGVSPRAQPPLPRPRTAVPTVASSVEQKAAVTTLPGYVIEELEEVEVRGNAHHGVIRTLIRGDMARTDNEINKVSLIVDSGSTGVTAVFRNKKTWWSLEASSVPEFAESAMTEYGVKRAADGGITVPAGLFSATGRTKTINVAVPADGGPTGEVAVEVREYTIKVAPTDGGARVNEPVSAVVWIGNVPGYASIVRQRFKPWIGAGLAADGFWLQLDELDGVPLITDVRWAETAPTTRVVTQLVRVEPRPIADAEFAVPEGFQRVADPFAQRRGKK